MASHNSKKILVVKTTGAVTKYIKALSVLILNCEPYFTNIWCRLVRMVNFTTSLRTSTNSTTETTNTTAAVKIEVIQLAANFTGTDFYKQHFNYYINLSI